jgi:hypothetical protein
MVAALLLDWESRSLVLDKDPAHGSILEPVGKFVRVLRSLEFEADLNDPIFALERICKTKSVNNRTSYRMSSLSFYPSILHLVSSSAELTQQLICIRLTFFSR